MPPEIPDVHVIDDPLVVFVFAGLFTAVVVLALLFAIPRFNSVRDDYAVGDRPETGNGDARRARPPWSTAPADAARPWQPCPQAAPGLKRNR